LFSCVDSTLTPLGSQCLYHKLRIYRDDPGELEKDYAAYQVLRRNTALREQLRLNLWSVGRCTTRHDKLAVPVCDDVWRMISNSLTRTERSSFCVLAVRGSTRRSARPLTR
jgi:hypothetical protein